MALHKRLKFGDEEIVACFRKILTLGKPLKT